MGWLDSIWGKKDDDDPLGDLDPSLRRYLESQRPREYRTEVEREARNGVPTTTSSSSTGGTKTGETGAEQPTQAEKTYRSLLGLDTHNDPEAQHAEKKQQANTHSLNPSTPSTDTSETPSVPPQSLFPDGRYSTLWSTYQPLSHLESAGKSDQEKLLDVLGGYKERRNQISRAASENCSELSLALNECFRLGGWKSRMSMCRKETQALGRCMVTQARLLRALGYLSLYERTEEESERIQMHADRLFWEMKRRERAAEEARERGEEPPSFAPLLKGVYSDGDADASPDAQDQQQQTQGEQQAKPTSGDLADRGLRVSYASLPSEVKLKLASARFKGLSGDDLALAKLELEEDIAVKLDLVRKLNDRYVEEKKERDVRREKGEERFGDVVKRYFDFRKYPESEGEEAVLTGRREGASSEGAAGEGGK